MGAFDHLEWTYDGAFEQLFGLGRGEFSKNFPKIQMHRGLPGGYWSFDLTGTLSAEYPDYLWCSCSVEHFDHTSCTSLSFAELEFLFSIPLQRFTNQTRLEGQSYLAMIAQQRTNLIICWLPPSVQYRYLKGTTDFLNFIEKTKVAKGTMLVSIEVTSLYTNIPQEERINIVKHTRHST